MRTATAYQPDCTHTHEAKAFRDAYGFTEFDAHLQLTLIEEEFGEFDYEASCSPSEEEPAKTLKELADLVFTCYQYAAARGWNLDVALTRVFESNMSKLDIDGLPIKNADGKVLKGPRYQEPEMADLV
jgi:hypothetical protein